MIDTQQSKKFTFRLEGERRASLKVLCAQEQVSAQNLLVSFVDLMIDNAATLSRKDLLNRARLLERESREAQHG